MLIAGPNLTIDRAICLAELRPGEVMRASAGEVGAGGKGVNVVSDVWRPSNAVRCIEWRFPSTFESPCFPRRRTRRW